MSELFAGSHTKQEISALRCRRFRHGPPRSYWRRVRNRVNWRVFELPNSVAPWSSWPKRRSRRH